MSSSALGPIQPQVHWVSGVLSMGVVGVHWLGHEGNISPPSCAEINGWSYTSTPPIYLYGMDWDSCALLRFSKCVMC